MGSSFRHCADHIRLCCEFFNRHLLKGELLFLQIQLIRNPLQNSVEWSPSLLESRVDGGEYVEEVGSRLRRVKLEGGRVVLRRHHDEPRQGNLHKSQNVS